MPRALAQFDHQDWLGTERARTSTSGAVVESFGSLPFGDGYTYNAPEGDSDPYHFAGYDQDSSSNEHAQFREYSNMAGRWFSPDPYQGSYDPNNPQSFNRYAYVLNNPLGFTDPTGLVLCDTGTTDANGNEVFTDDPNCAADGGTVVDVTTTVVVGGSGSGTWFPPTENPPIVTTIPQAPNNSSTMTNIKQKITRFVCKNSPDNRVLASMEFGFVTGALRGGVAGATGGVFFGLFARKCKTLCCCWGFEE